LRQLVDLVAANQVRARIADVPDVRLALVDGDARDGRTHAAPTLLLDRSGVHAPVSQTDRLVDELVDTDDRLVRPDLVDVPTEAFVEHLHRQLAGDLTSRRTTHAVGHGKQRQVAVTDRELPHAVVVLVEGSHPPNV